MCDGAFATGCPLPWARTCNACGGCRRCVVHVQASLFFVAARFVQGHIQNPSGGKHRRHHTRKAEHTVQHIARLAYAVPHRLPEHHQNPQIASDLGSLFAICTLDQVANVRSTYTDPNALQPLARCWITLQLTMHRGLRTTKRLCRHTLTCKSVGSCQRPKVCIPTGLLSHIRSSPLPPNLGREYWYQLGPLPHLLACKQDRSSTPSFGWTLCPQKMSGAACVPQLHLIV